MSSTTRSGCEVGLAGAAELPAVRDVLAAAFFDDPVFSWCVPHDDLRWALLPRLFEVFTAEFARHGATYLTADRSGAALWSPPGVEAVEPEPVERLLARVGAIDGPSASRCAYLAETFQAQHPAEPCAYLGFVGVLPDRQGQGVGSALLREALSRWDASGYPSYLEASSVANRRLYDRRGFTVLGEIRLPDGPPAWPMWRPGSA